MLDVFHCKGGAEDGVFEQRLRFIALIKSSRIPTKDSSGENGVKYLCGQHL